MITFSGTLKFLWYFLDGCIYAPRYMLKELFVLYDTLLYTNNNVV